MTRPFRIERTFRVLLATCAVVLLTLSSSPSCTRTPVAKPKAETGAAVAATPVAPVAGPVAAATAPLAGDELTSRLDFLTFGDWGMNNTTQRKVAATMRDYVLGQ